MFLESSNQDRQGSCLNSLNTLKTCVKEELCCQIVANQSFIETMMCFMSKRGYIFYDHSLFNHDFFSTYFLIFDYLITIISNSLSTRVGQRRKQSRSTPSVLVIQSIVMHRRTMQSGGKDWMWTVFCSVIWFYCSSWVPSSHKRWRWILGWTYERMMRLLNSNFSNLDPSTHLACRFAVEVATRSLQFVLWVNLKFKNFENFL